MQGLLCLRPCIAALTRVAMPTHTLPCCKPMSIKCLGLHYLDTSPDLLPARAATACITDCYIPSALGLL